MLASTTEETSTGKELIAYFSNHYCLGNRRSDAHYHSDKLQRHAAKMSWYLQSLVIRAECAECGHLSPKGTKISESSTTCAHKHLLSSKAGIAGAAADQAPT